MTDNMPLVNEETKNSFKDELKIADWIKVISFGITTLYVIQGNDGLVLVDTGPPHKAKKLLAQLEKEGIKIHDIRTILLTHNHPDHTGNLKALKDITNARIAIGKEDAPGLLKGHISFPKSRNILGYFIKFIHFFIGFRYKVSGFEPDIELDDRESLEKFGLDGFVLHTPGHTKGSVTYVLNDGHVFIGDLMTYYNRPYQPPFAENLNGICKSLVKLYGNKLNVIYPGHGLPFKPSQVSDLYQQICMQENISLDDIYNRQIDESQEKNI